MVFSSWFLVFGCLSLTRYWRKVLRGRGRGVRSQEKTSCVLLYSWMFWGCPPLLPSCKCREARKNTVERKYQIPPSGGTFWPLVKMGRPQSSKQIKSGGQSNNNTYWTAPFLVLKKFTVFTWGCNMISPGIKNYKKSLDICFALIRIVII